MQAIKKEEIPVTGQRKMREWKVEWKWFTESRSIFIKEKKRKTEKVPRRSRCLEK